MNTKLRQKLNKYLADDNDFRRTYDYTKQRFEASPQLTGHNFEHARRDTINSIAIGEPENADMAVVLCSAVMHDIGFLYGAHRSVHGEIGAEKLFEFLRDGGITLESAKLERIAECIRTHKGATHGISPVSLEAKVVADADLLDKFGPVGLYQTILSFGELGFVPEDVIRRMFGRTHLQFETSTGTKLGSGLQSYNQEFAESLERAYAPYGFDVSKEKL